MEQRILQPTREHQQHDHEDYDWHISNCVFSTNNFTDCKLQQLIPDASEPEPECTDSPSEKDTDSDWESLASLRVS